MNSEDIDWHALERLRAAFLQGTAGHADYWRTERELASYDATFAQRIGWKWDYVLAELSRRGWVPPGGELLDWGCGSGIAGRAFLGHFGVKSVGSLALWDRSGLAMQFAANRARTKFPGLTVTTGFPTSPGVLLISHVLTELKPEQAQQLADFAAASATTVIWVEPGTYDASLALIAVRERLRAKLNVVAPCTHAATCGILAKGNEAHWCHHFASSPPAVFVDGDWARFANFMGIDLSSLPLSFLVLDRRPAPAVPPGAVRLIGGARVAKAEAKFLACDATGVAQRHLPRRTFPEEYRRVRKRLVDPLQVWECAGDQIKAVREFGGTPPG